MREILFRGKDKNTNEWSYGSLMCFHGYQIYDNTRVSWVSVRGETVGQYTGLTDTNGKKIFEGDVLKYTRTKWNEPLHSDNGKDIVSFHEIYFDENEGSLKQKHYTDKGNLIASGYMFSFIDVRADENKIEVIGNIYDNPELLEEK